MGRITGGSICNNGSLTQGCGGSPVYEFTATWQGPYLTSSKDSVVNQGLTGTSSYAYNNFGQIMSQTVTGAQPASYSYNYDIWGNRWQQNVISGGSGPQPQLSFDENTNRVTGTGYSYDAAGNMTSDTVHTYTYDAEGNITQVDRWRHSDVYL